MSARERPWLGRRIHFVGAGGAGMSGYARVAHALGAEVSGSDAAADSPYLRELAGDGVLVAGEPGHRESNLPEGEGVELVYSSAVDAENPERRAARERGIPERPRAALLGELTGMRRTIAVAGTHGKTTTASMLAHALRGAGAKPGWLVGAPIGGGLPNAHWGEGEWLVVEADESDRSMLALRVEVAVLMNVELDHHATFASLAELRAAFAEFLARAGRAVIVWERPELVELAHGALEAHVPPRGGPECPVGPELVTFDVPAPVLTGEGSSFPWRGQEVRLGVPGAHNALDAAAALEAVRLTGVDVRGALAALADFRGAARRFQRLGRTRGGAEVYEDYAHHPTEIGATLAGARTLEHRRLVAVFQPHLYSRTKMLGREFGAALAQADVAVLLDVYPARECPEEHPGVSGLLIAEAVADAAGGRPVYWLPHFEEARRTLEAMLEPGDLCVVMGAGDVDRLASELVAP